MIFLNVSDIIVNNKYKQLFIFRQFDGVRTINIYGRKARHKEEKLRISK